VLSLVKDGRGLGLVLVLVLELGLGEGTWRDLGKCLLASRDTNTNPNTNPNFHPNLSVACGRTSPVSSVLG
jgi:hypothetical protein